MIRDVIKNNSPIGVFLKGICLLSILAVILSTTRWLPISLTIELSVTAFCILFCYVCIFHVYQQHARTFHSEDQLKDQIIQLLAEQYGSNPPIVKMKEFLEKLLESKNTTNTRLELLQHLKQNKSVLSKMVIHLKQEEQGVNVLKDLGLRWEI